METNFKKKIFVLGGLCLLFAFLTFLLTSLQKRQVTQQRATGEGFTCEISFFRNPPSQKGCRGTGLQTAIIDSEVDYSVNRGTCYVCRTLSDCLASDIPLFSNFSNFFNADTDALQIINCLPKAAPTATTAPILTPAATPTPIISITTPRNGSVFHPGDIYINPGDNTLPSRPYVDFSFLPNLPASQVPDSIKVNLYKGSAVCGTGWVTKMEAKSSLDRGSSPSLYKLDATSGATTNVLCPRWMEMDSFNNVYLDFGSYYFAVWTRKAGLENSVAISRFTYQAATAPTLTKTPTSTPPITGSVQVVLESTMSGQYINPSTDYNYTIKVTNNTNKEIDNVTIDQLAPSYSEYLRAENQLGERVNPVTTGEIQTWGFTAIPVGQTKWIKLFYKTTSNLPCSGRIEIYAVNLIYNIVGRGNTGVSNNIIINGICGPTPTFGGPTPTSSPTSTPRPTMPPSFGMTLELVGDMSACPDQAYTVRGVVTNTTLTEKTINFSWGLPQESTFDSVSYNSAPTPFPTPVISGSTYSLNGVKVPAKSTIVIDLRFKINSGTSPKTLSVGPFWVRSGTQTGYSNIVGVAVRSGSQCNVCPKGGLGDLNCDGIVNITDLTMLLDKWGTNGIFTQTSYHSADIVTDSANIVNIADLTKLLDNWSK